MIFNIPKHCHLHFAFPFLRAPIYPELPAVPLSLFLSFFFWQTPVSGTGVSQTSKLAQREWGRGHAGTTRVTSKLRGFPRAATLSLRLCRSETQDMRRKTPAGTGWQTSRCAQKTNTHSPIGAGWESVEGRQGGGCLNQCIYMTLAKKEEMICLIRRPVENWPSNSDWFWISPKNTSR